MKRPMTKRRYSEHLKHLSELLETMQIEQTTVKAVELLTNSADPLNSCIKLTLGNNDNWLIGSGAITVEKIL